MPCQGRRGSGVHQRAKHLVMSTRVDDGSARAPPDGVVRRGEGGYQGRDARLSRQRSQASLLLGAGEKVLQRARRSGVPTAVS